MTTSSVSWARCAVGLLGALALAACATRTPIRPASTEHVVSASAASAATALRSMPPAATASVAPVAPAGQVIPTVPAAAPKPHYANLFARIRAGMRLPQPNMPVIAQEAHWYANHPQFLQRSFNRADMYLYYIVTQLQKRHMPLELSLLPIIESAYRPYAYSWARAAGMWQFTSGTGKLFGLKQDWWYDGRLNVIASTQAALDYLQQLHKQLGGSWLLAIAAYNCGVENVERAVRYNQARGLPTDFWNLILPRETELYVPQLLAMARLVADPAKYGLSFSPIPDRPYFTKVPTGGQINLEVAAHLAGITSDEIYQLNPAFLRWATDPTGPFYLLLPIDAAPVFEQNVRDLTADERMGVERYVVHAGDTVYSIARRFNTTTDLLRRLNNLPNGRLLVGQDIDVPTTAYRLPHNVLVAAEQNDRSLWRHDFRFRVVRVRPGDSLWAIAQRNGMSVQRLAQINGLSVRHSILYPGEPLRLYADARVGRFRLPGVRVVRVRPGDSLWSIAVRNHVSVHALARANGLSIYHPILRPGEQLRILPSMATVQYNTRRALLSGIERGVHRIIYTVHAGDTLWQIARRFQVRIHQILAWNEMTLDRPILAGQKLMILADSGG
ncbi:MAG: LysM peptidoglycan-binding domain-containing protein [Steroidobacteraceae bacterium]